MNTRLRSLWLLVLLAVAAIPSWAQQAVSISTTPDTLANGSPCLFTVSAPGVTQVTGTWQKHKLAFFRTSSHDAWDALAGIDVDTDPGSYPLNIEVTFAGGATQKLDRTLKVEAAPYKSTTLTVPDKFVAPNAAAMKIIAADRIVKDKAYASTAPRPLWTGNFTPPLHAAPSTDSFGTRRIFNGSLASVHRGLDYRAKTGTPVRAVNSGRVVVARLLYFEGNCVIIDHGQGFMTQYMHLSRFKVKEGQLVKRGQLLALSGGTGRATGPHLHLGVRWDGTSLDAQKLFLLDLPRPVLP
jgi:murein DD-endopeptidase MepM/ murein hydrolase activator NlpD